MPYISRPARNLLPRKRSGNKATLTADYNEDSKRRRLSMDNDSPSVSDGTRCAESVWTRACLEFITTTHLVGRTDAFRTVFDHGLEPPERPLLFPVTARLRFFLAGSYFVPSADLL